MIFFLAIAFLSTLPRTYGTTFEELVEKGQTAVDTGRFQEALWIFQHTNSVAPERKEEFSLDWAWAHARLGRMERQKGSCQEACDQFDAAIEIHPEIAGIIKNEWAFCIAKIIEEALENAAETDLPSLEEKAQAFLLLLPKGNLVRLRLGGIYEQIGEKETAAAEYRRILGKASDQSDIDQLRDDANMRVQKKRVSLSLFRHPLLKGGSGGRFSALKREPFIIHHHNKKLAERVARALEYYLNEAVLGGVLPGNRHTPEAVHVFLARNTNEYNSLESIPDKRGYASKHDTIHIKHTDPHTFDSVLPHELAHLRFANLRSASMSGKKGKVSLFAFEGVAVSAESADSKIQIARRMEKAREKGTFISIKDVVNATKYPSKRSRVKMLHDTSVALVECLVKRYGKYKFIKFTTTTSDIGGMKALKISLGVKGRDLEEMLDEWIEEKLYSP